MDEIFLSNIGAILVKWKYPNIGEIFRVNIGQDIVSKNNIDTTFFFCYWRMRRWSTYAMPSTVKRDFQYTNPCKHAFKYPYPVKMLSNPNYFQTVNFWLQFFRVHRTVGTDVTKVAWRLVTIYRCFVGKNKSLLLYSLLFTIIL